MSKIDDISLVECGCCGKFASKIWRRYRDIAYCSICYAREFKHRECPSCEKTAKLPIKYQDAICRKCERQKPCARCGRTDLKIGKITPQGPVCSACSKYFREKSVCDNCGVTDFGVSKSSHYPDHIRVCQRCATKHHQSCHRCGKHREVFAKSDGNKVCKRCLRDGNVLCKQCGALHPSGEGEICRACYQSNLLFKRAEITAQGLRTTEFQRCFREFASWLGQQSGSPMASRKISLHLCVFVEVEDIWGEWPLYSVLLDHFGLERLKKHKKIFKWLEVKKFIQLDTQAYQNAQEVHRISKQITTFSKTDFRSKLIRQYADSMLQRSDKGDVSLLTVRLALTPAIALLEFVGQLSANKVDQRSLELYLKVKPGQRASIFGFVTFLNKKFDDQLLVPNKKDLLALRANFSSLERNLVSIIESGEGDGADRDAWLKLSLEYFHGLIVTKDNDWVVNSSPGRVPGYDVLYKNETYWVPLSSSFSM